ncbi:Netrin receptor UNC5A [Orchesella cincta]|uniref:Netrin receptor UNC5A n=1 Tax=Orchesella cincta TaxID=48709 RepID=A0A1D2MDL5_ORCCI|nr:Netrin receptor UNC5A [Orchesella cincta]
MGVLDSERGNWSVEEYWSPKPPEYIFWYHNERMINYGNSREVVVRTEPGARTHSRLTIRDARISDTGNYTCSCAHAEPASIFVYVSQEATTTPYSENTSTPLFPCKENKKTNRRNAGDFCHVSSPD